ncbi:MAG TPA: tetratricopeptide repeat protein [Gammaproteobacteria bacterium]|nr:tetratricopeptide repeat protein [Gammaproteobacteria bacterium]
MNWLSSRSAEHPVSLIPTSLMAIFIAVGLGSCEAGPDSPATNKISTDGPVVQPVSQPAIPQSTVKQTSSKRSGAHSRRDPHAQLTPDKQLQVALQHLAEGRTQLAMNTLNQAIGNYPDSAELYGVRGSLFLEQGSSAAALADLNRAVELAPHNPAFLNNRAQAFRRFERTKEALADLDHAIELDSHFVAARFNRGTIAFNAGKYSQAMTDFDACVAADPQSAAPYFNRASVHDAMGHRELAIADLNRFLEIADSEQWKNVAKALLLKWENTDNSAAKSDQS